MNHGTILYKLVFVNCAECDHYSMQSSASGHLITGGDEKFLKLLITFNTNKERLYMTVHTKSV